MNNNHTIFISSTFKDMHAERDILHNIVLPELDTYFSQYAANIDIVDLRWGIDTENAQDEAAATAKILQVCFDEIDRSNPFFVCFIGNRYGWVPERDMIRSSCLNAGLPATEYEGRSITEMEIEYAISKYEKLDNCFFFFREGLSPEDIPDARHRAIYFSEDPEDAKRIQQLKRRLAEKHPERMFTYSCHWDQEASCIGGLETLAELLTEKIRKGISEKAGANERLSSDECVLERAVQENHYLRISNQTVDRSLYTQEMLSFALGEDPRREMAIVAESGFGKTSLVAYTVRRLEEKGVYVLKLSGGLTQNSADFKFAVRYFYSTLANDFGRTFIDGSYEEIKKNFLSLLDDIAQQRRIVIVIDALNQFSSSAELEKLDWINEMFIPSNVRILYSCLPKQFERVFRQRNVAVKTLERLETSEIADIAVKTAGSFHKQLSAEAIGLLVDRKNQQGERVCGIPLYLSMIIEYVSEFDIDDYNRIADLEARFENGAHAINYYIAEKIRSAPEDINKLFGAISVKCERIVAPEAVRLINTLIERSRFGIREADILGIAQRMGINLNAFDFSLYRKRFRLHLVQREDGRWDFVHGILRRAASHLSGQQNDSWLQRVADATADHFLSLPREESLRQRELLYYLGCCRRYAPIRRMVADASDAPLSKVERRELLELLTKDAEENGRSVHSAALFDPSAGEALSAPLCKWLLLAAEENVQNLSGEMLLPVLLEIIDSLRPNPGTEVLPLLAKAYFMTGSCLLRTNGKDASVMFRICLAIAKKISPVVQADYLLKLYGIHDDLEEHQSALRFAKQLVRCVDKNKDAFSPEAHRVKYIQSCIFMAETLRKTPFAYSRHRPQTWYAMALKVATKHTALYDTALSGYSTCKKGLKRKQRAAKIQDYFDNAGLSQAGVGYYCAMGDRFFKKNPEKAGKMYHKALDMIRAMLQDQEDPSLLKLYEAVAEKLGYFYALQPVTQPKAIEYLMLAQRLCRKIYMIDEEVQWNDKRLHILQDLSLLTPAGGGEEDSAKQAYAEAAALSYQTIRSGVKISANQMTRFAGNAITAIIAAILLVGLFLQPLAAGEFNMQQIVSRFPDMMQFILAFLLVLPIVQFLLGRMRPCEDTVQFYNNRKQLSRGIILYLATLSLTVFISVMLDAGTYVAEGFGVLLFQTVTYYVLNGTLVFILGWFGTNIVFHIFQNYAQASRISNHASQMLHARKTVAREGMNLLVMAVLPVTFYIALVSGVEIESLTYNGDKVEDFWKIHWLPFVVQAGFFAVTLFKLRKSGFKRRAHQAGSFQQDACRKLLRQISLRSVGAAILICAVLTTSIFVYAGQIKDAPEQVGAYLSEGGYQYLEMPDGIMIKGYTGDETQLHIPEQIQNQPVTTIGSSAFAYSSIETVVLPDSVKTIEAGAFRGCAQLTSAQIGKGLSVIGEYAFADCTALMELPLSDSVTQVESYAFENCTSITELIFPSGITKIEDGVFSGCTGLKQLDLPEHITELSDEVFANCTGLTQVRLNSNLEEIWYGVFSGCTSLETMYYDATDCWVVAYSTNGVLTSSFQKLQSLKKVVFGDSVKTISAGAFRGCSALEQIEWGSQLETIEAQAFAECTGLKEVVLPESVQSVGDFAFGDCTALERFTIGENISALADTALEGCEAVVIIDLRQAEEVQ